MEKLKIKKTMCNRHLFLGCSEIKTTKKYHFTKLCDLISDILVSPKQINIYSIF